MRPVGRGEPRTADPFRTDSQPSSHLTFPRVCRAGLRNKRKFVGTLWLGRFFGATEGDRNMSKNILEEFERWSWRSARSAPLLIVAALAAAACGNSSPSTGAGGSSPDHEPG